jgi:hypothetical protein
MAVVMPNPAIAGRVSVAASQGLPARAVPDLAMPNPAIAGRVSVAASQGLPARAVPDLAMPNPAIAGRISVAASQGLPARAVPESAQSVPTSHRSGRAHAARNHTARTDRNPISVEVRSQLRLNRSVRLLIGTSPRGSACKRCCLALDWPRVARWRIGSAPDVLPSTASLRFSVSG